MDGTCSFSNRHMLEFKAEIIVAERQELDELSFSSLIGLTKGEMQAVYEAVIDLVESRLERARSV